MSAFSKGVQIFREGLVTKGNELFREEQEEKFVKAFFTEFDGYKKKKSKNKTDLKKITKLAIARYFDEF
jgi:hypothetical protein